MDRHDLYTTVHKGVRALLFEAAGLVARTDFSSVDEAARTQAALTRLLGFLDEHAEHEDDCILPELAAIAPELHADLRSAHARLHGLQDEVAKLAARLPGANGAERVALGRRLHERMGPLVAEHLRHMEQEEGPANRMLWAHRTDEALRAIEGRIVGAIPPPRLSEWLGIMLPAMSMPERAPMVREMRAGMPPEVFEALTVHARGALGPAGWTEVLLAADAAPASVGGAA